MAAVIEATPRLVFAEYGRSLVIRPAEGEDTGALFNRICVEFGNTRIEQDSQGNVLIMAPTGGEGSDQTSEINMQLRLWAKHDGRGRAFESNVLFLLPDGSRRGPDAAWVSKERLSTLSLAQRRKFLPLVPEFVIELKSPSDHLTDLQGKMEDWIRNGVELGWLIHPDRRLVLIYRKTRDGVEEFHGTLLSGEGPVQGFEFDLEPIWRGLDIG